MIKYRSDLFRDIDDEEIISEGLTIELPGGFYNDPNEYIVYGPKEELSKLKDHINDNMKNIKTSSKHWQNK